MLDEFGAGFPIAWCLSNHEDFTHMCVFLEMVRKNSGVLSPHWLMSDLASQFYNAWLAIMGGSPKRLYCTWHVDRAWQQELRAKVKDTIIAAEIYKMLRTVLQQTEVATFKQYLSQLVERLPALSVEFFSYFRSEWYGRTEYWAYCYRRGMGINTNMAVEAFHRVFKYSYLKGKANRRVDYCLISLMKFIRDKSFDRAIKLTKGKQTFKTKLIHDRHNESKGMSTEAVKEDGDSRWKISSSNCDMTYTVLKQAKYCMEDTCQVRCEQCRICIHQFICNCPDSLIHNTIRKHIHLLQSYLSTKEEETCVNSAKPVGTNIDDYKATELKLVASHLQGKIMLM